MAVLDKSPLSRTYAPADGPRVRLRLARRSDARALGELLASCGVAASELELRRFLTYDPLSRIVLSAFTPVRARDVLVGVGAIDFAEGAEPDTLVVDALLAPGLRELLAAMLERRAGSPPRSAA